jgi:hypothetical protein
MCRSVSSRSLVWRRCGSVSRATSVNDDPSANSPKSSFKRYKPRSMRTSHEGQHTLTPHSTWRVAHTVTLTVLVMCVLACSEIPEVEFDELLEDVVGARVGRRDRSVSFFQLLVLTSLNIVRVRQVSQSAQLTHARPAPFCPFCAHAVGLYVRLLRTLPSSSNEGRGGRRGSAPLSHSEGENRAEEKGIGWDESQWSGRS